jgi:hypothetical protein
MTDLRNHLFETLEGLKDSENPMDLDRARAISQVAQVIINTATVEVALLKAVNASAPASRAFFEFPEENSRLSIPPSAQLTRGI